MTKIKASDKSRLKRDQELDLAPIKVLIRALIDMPKQHNLVPSDNLFLTNENINQVQVLTILKKLIDTPESRFHRIKFQKLKKRALFEA